MTAPMKQLSLDDNLMYVPPPAVVTGDQRLWWCQQCGAVLITMTGTKPTGACPSCDRTMWQRARLPICGLYRGDTPPEWINFTGETPGPYREGVA